MIPLNLDLIWEDLRDRAVADLDSGDVTGFLVKAEHGNQHHLGIVWQNCTALIERGLYERALIAAWSSCRVNHSAWRTDNLRLLFRLADRRRLYEAGAPLPGPGPFTLYRGVAGRGRRRVRGFSWTDDVETAGWFALRYPLTLRDPAVYRTVVQADAVLAFLTNREEREFLILPPSRVTRLMGPILTRRETETCAP